LLLLDYRRLPPPLHTPQARQAWQELNRKRGQLAIKRAFDLTAALGLMVLLAPVTGGIALAIASEGDGPILFRQQRVGRYGKPFVILKFRTMAVGSGARGSLSLKGDSRVTGVGRVLREYRLDEIPQLINVLRGEMSFVGPRPEVPEFVAHYTPEMLSTLLLPVGLTSRASIRFRNEAALLTGRDSRRVYLEQILPEKMACNLEYLHRFHLMEDIKILIDTLRCVLEKE